MQDRSSTSLRLDLCYGIQAGPLDKAADALSGDLCIAQVERKDLAWERWYDLSSQEIGELIKAPKIGKQLHRMIHEFPRLELAAQVCANPPASACTAAWEQR